MSKIRISADSTCDLSKELLARFNVTITPLYIVNKDKSYKDGVEITRDELYRICEGQKELCSTAAVNVYDYEENFKKLLEDADYVIQFCISSEMSSSYHNACTAAEEFDGRVFVVDSRNLSTGIGLLVCEAAELAEKGEMTAEEIAQRMRERASKLEVSFVVDTMDYLRRGGRCSALTALGAGMLKIKPCIAVIDGKMTVAKTYKGNIEKCLKRYVKERLAERDDIDMHRIFITESGVKEGIVDMVRAEIEEAGKFDEILHTEAGCTIGCHCGPGTLGILFFRK